MRGTSAIVPSVIFSLLVAGSAAAVDSETAIARQAGALYAQGQLGSATKVLREGVREYPDSAQLHFMLGNALMRAHAWHAAIPEYQASAKLRPQHPDTYLNLGYALFHSGMPSKAVDAWKTASQQSPRDSLIRASLAISLLATGDRPAALKEIAAAQGIDPGWRRIAAVDFRWNDRMRADADNLARGSNAADSKRGIDDREDSGAGTGKGPVSHA